MAFAPAALHAAINPAPDAARFLHLTVEHGLSQNTVRDILQDRHGFLWFATEEGLNRYDGYEFVQFKHQHGQSASLPNDTVTALHEDRQGRLWVGTRAGLSLYEAESESFRPRLRVQEEVMAIIEDRHGCLWIGTAGEGLFRFDEGATTPVRYTAGTGPRDLADNTIYALLEDRQGDIWIGTFGGGVDRLDPKHERVTHHRHDPRQPGTVIHNEIWSLTEDALGQIWVGTNGAGVSVLDASRRTFRHYQYDARNPKSLQDDLVASLYVDSDGSVWLGTDRGGLNRYVREDDGFVAYKHSAQNPDSIGWNAVRAIYEDRQGNLWVSTFAAGLNWLRRNANPFRYHRGPGVAGGSVSSFLQDRDDTLWIGGQGRVLRFDPQGEHFRSYPLGSAAVLTLHQDRRGRIWAGTWGQGLLRFDVEQGRLTPFRNPLENPNTREDEQLWDIHEDEQGALWLATDDGVFRLDPDSGRGVHFKHDESDPKSLGHDKARAFQRDDSGNLWIATLGGGLSVLNPDGRTFTRYRHDASDARTLSNDWVISLHRDRKGRLWAGTFGGGLNLFDAATGKFTVYGAEAGIPSNTVYAMLEDDRGRLWLSTNRGLCRFDPAARSSETFDTTNGLQNLQFNLGAGLMTRDGTMFFGSWNGFYSFDPDRVTPDPRVPPLAFTSLKILNRTAKTAAALATTDEIRLRHDEKMIAVEFVVLDYTFPRRNSYQYRLEGFNNDWILVDNNRRDVSFTNLDPGSYVLHVKGSNSDGVWDDKGRSLRIVVSPPFWATWWFRTVTVVSFFGTILSLHLYRIRLHERREQELQVRVDDAVSKLKILKGLLPICATCKKVRDDKGYWSQIESYLRTHSEADFSHGICPDCIAKYWGNTRAAAALKKRES